MFFFPLCVLLESHESMTKLGTISDPKILTGPSSSSLSSVFVATATEAGMLDHIDNYIAGDESI